MEQLTSLLSSTEINISWMRIFLFIVAVLSLCACYPASNPPAQVIFPMETTRATTTAAATISVATISMIEEIFTPTLTRPSVRATTTPEKVMETPTPVTRPLIITIVYDNNPYDRRLRSAWGFSALIEYRDHTLLFDTGGDGQKLMDNIRILGIDPTRIDSVVFSHAHGDHTGGLTALLDPEVKPVVYLLPSFPANFKRQIEQLTQISEVAPGQSLAEGLWTTGEMGTSIHEQALVIQTERGLVVITGCAHPGIVAIVKRARDMFAQPVRLVLGGFHLGSKSRAEIDSILEDFRRLEVEMVAPCHCTGDSAIRMFAAEYGEDFIRVGVGSVIKLEE